MSSLQRLPRAFFARPTSVVAHDLLGKILVRRRGKKTFTVRICETEAYHGENDLACHAHVGRTTRTEPLYGKPGTVYVFLIYGMYHCLNVVTVKKDFPGAVLLRGALPLLATKDLPGHVLRGPGRLTKTLGITRTENGKDSIQSSSLWIGDDGTRVPEKEVQKTPRIGVAYAGPRWSQIHWRFLWEKPSQEKEALL